MKVRIALVINDKGQWCAAGFYKYSDKDAVEVASEGLCEVGSEERTYMVEADIPIPQPTTVQGTVTDA